MKAYYFSEADCRLRYGDGRLIEIGVTHEVARPEDITLCQYGLHASLSVWDALQYAPGKILWEVELGGSIQEGSDKVVASKRSYLKKLDATEILREYARRCALAVAHLWDAPKSVTDYLETGDEKLRAAAAGAAAWDAGEAAGEAAWAAARAARAAAGEAAWDAGEAAGEAAWDAAARAAAAWAAAARAAAGEAARAAAGEAAWDAGEAAWDAGEAARNKQRELLERLVKTAFDKCL